MEKIKEFFRQHPWVAGILLAIPVVIIYWIISRRRAESQDYQPAGMIYQPPAGGGGGGTAGGGFDTSTVTNMMTDFLNALKQQQDTQSQQLTQFLQAQAEAQKAFMESMAGQQANIQKSFTEQLQAFLNSISQRTQQQPTVIMPPVPQVPQTREIYTPSGQSFTIPKGIVSVADMPGKTEDEKWAQFEQTIAYDYLGNVVREAQQRILNYKAQWGQASSPEQQAQIHQQAQAERQRVYQEITRGGAGFSATWVDTGQGYSELQVRTPKGEVLRL